MNSNFEASDTVSTTRRSCRQNALDGHGYMLRKLGLGEKQGGAGRVCWRGTGSSEKMYQILRTTCLSALLAICYSVDERGEPQRQRWVALELQKRPLLRQQKLQLSALCGCVVKEADGKKS